MSFFLSFFFSAPVTGNHKLSPGVASTNPQSCTNTGGEGGGPDGDERSKESACQNAVSNGGGESAWRVGVS